jgi:hypothetical protein
MAWQAWRNGQADIWLTSLDDAAKAVRVTDSPANDWSPAIACDDQGRLHIAYDTYAAGNHDVYLRTFADGKLSAPVAVATSSRFEARPSIACDDNGRVWIAYEQRAADWGKDFGPLASLQGSPLYQRGASVQVRVVSNGKLQQPASDLTKQLPPQLQRFNSYPRLALDGQGRPWLLFRHRHEAFWGLCAQMMVGGVWFEYATSFDGEKWTPPVFLPASDNLLDVRPALARTRGGRLLAIYPSDGRLRHEAIGSEQQRKTFFVTAGTSVAGQAKNDLFAAALPALEKTKPAQWTSAQANQPGFAGLGPDQELHRAAKPIEADPESKQLHPNTAADIQRLRDHVIEAGGKKYRLLRGEFHRHTELSADGGNDGSLEDMWRYALDAADFDWMGNGDHDSGGGREYSWWLQQKLADVYNQPPRFVAMFTYERSNPYPNGHRNCMFDRRGVRTLPRLIGDDPGGISTNDTRMLYAYLNQLGGVCASHTSGTGMGTDWRDTDAAAEPIVEIYQGCRNSYEALGGPRVARKQGEVIGGWRPLGMVWNAMAMGYKMGFQASSDHVSTHISYAVAIAEDRSRAAVLDAFRKRRCYGATDNIVLDVRMGDHIMGEEFTVGPGQKPPLLSVRVIGTAPIARIDVVKDFHYVHTAEPKKASVSFTWADSELGPGVSWYYVRAVQTDGQVAWGSPIWVKSPQPQAGKRKGNR